MLAAEPRTRRKPLTGSPRPHYAPPMPARSLLAQFKETASALGIELMAWQEIAGRFLTALGRGSDWLYREICIVVARQNGKTTLLFPLIVMALEDGLSILHTAQDGSLPLETFDALADLLEGDPRVKRIRRANGKETIYFKNGGRYTVLPPTRGVRGRSADLIIIDEVREQHDDRLTKAILPTITARPKVRIVYLSNAGDPESVILNDLRARRDSSDRLAYLEWSAHPERDIDDRRGWAEANPALGVTITEERLAELREAFAHAPEAFETEHLCRWVASMDQRLVDPKDWLAQNFSDLPDPAFRRYMGVCMDQNVGRASAVIAWQVGPDEVCLDVVGDASGLVSDVGREFQKLAEHYKVTAIAYDPYSEDLARYLRKAQRPTTGRDLVVGSGKFVQLTESHKFHVRDDAGVIAKDLAWTTRKSVGDRAYMAVAASDEHSITAVQAAIRAVWLASAPQSTGRMMIG